MQGIHAEANSLLYRSPPEYMRLTYSLKRALLTLTANLSSILCRGEILVSLYVGGALVFASAGVSCLWTIVARGDFLLAGISSLCLTEASKPRHISTVTKGGLLVAMAPAYGGMAYRWACSIAFRHLADNRTRWQVSSITAFVCTVSDDGRLVTAKC